MAAIVVSYRRSDSVAIAGRVFDRLVARYGEAAVFMGAEDPAPVPVLRERIDQALAQARIVLALVSRGSAADDDEAARLEIEAAVAQGVAIVPALVDGAALPAALKSRCTAGAMPVHSGRDFHGDMDALIRLIDPLLEGRAADAAPGVAEPEPATNGERRQITVMFCDLVGSTALATRLDPEDMREIIGGFQKACARVIPAYGGFIARYMGDGVLAYFGYPQAHEDAAEQAVRAGLDLVASIARMKTLPGLALQARAGIATGVVVIGELIGEGVARERQVVGEALNIAARLQAIAEPDMVFVSASTRRLLGRVFDCRDRGASEMKGFSAPVQAWQVLAERAVESRFDAMRSSEAPMVGREAEMELAMRLWRLAEQGEGRVLVISGEAGIGKSRIAASLGERLAAQGSRRLSYQCSPYHSNSALYPVIGQIERAAGFAPEDSAPQRLDKLARMLSAAVRDVAKVAPVFATLLSIPFDGRYPVADATALQQRRQTFEAILAQLEGLARKSAVLVLFEDVHWADATSLELLDLMVQRVRKLPVLLAITCRPEFPPPWTGLAHVSTLPLGRLERPHVRLLVEQVTMGHPLLPADVLDQIVTKTDGIPLFVEELTKAVLEAQALVDEHEGPRADGAPPLLAIPATLKDSLMARLDRLAPVAQVAQAGAAIGRTFSHSMIAAVSGHSEASLRVALQTLVDAELIFQRGAPPEATYLFKHALIQEAAYESMLRGKRQVLHGRIVQAIETRFPEMLETTPELVAHHCARAELLEKAVHYFTRAGQRALRLSSLAEAVSHFRSAIALLDGLPDSLERRKQELACQTAMAQALIGAKGYGAPETMAAWQRGYELALAVGDPQQSFAVTYGLWVGQYAQGQLATIDTLAEHCLRAAESGGDRTQRCVANRMTGIAHFIVGDFSRAGEFCARAVELYDRAAHPPLANQLGHDLLVAGLCFKGLSLWPLGRPDQARATLEAALRHARELDHGPSLAYSYWHAAIIGGLMLGDEAFVAAQADLLVAHAEKHGLALWAAWGRVAQGWGQARSGGGSAALEHAYAGLETVRKTGSRIYETTVLAMLGDAHAAAGDFDSALAIIGEGIGFAEASRQLYWLAELYRLRGTLLVRSGRDAAQAETALRQAVSVARLQKAPSWELRAANDLAGLLADTGRAPQVRALLEPVYARFQEGFETADLRAARTLLGA